MGRLFADENFPDPVVRALRRLGHDVMTMHDRGLSGKSIPDEEVLRIATAERRAVMTLNRRDFMNLHKHGPAHAGIIVCTVDIDFEGQAIRINKLLIEYPDLNGLLIRVNRG